MRRTMLLIVGFLFAASGTDLHARTVNFAVLIGVSNYEDSEHISALTFPKQDVERVRAALVSHAHYRPAHVKVLRTDPGPDELTPTKGRVEGVIRALQDSLSRNMHPPDSANVLVYFAGHGKPVSAEIGTTEPELALLMQDATLGLTHTYLRDRQLVQWLSEFPENARRFVVLDACFAGLREAATRDIGMVDYAQSGSGILNGIDALIASSGPRERAQDDGVFAELFAQALERSSELQGSDMRLSAGELMDYVGRGVAAQTGRRQNPEIVGGRGESDILVDNSFGYVTIETVPPGARVQIRTRGSDLWTPPLVTPQREVAVPVGTCVLTITPGTEFETEQDLSFVVNAGYRNPPRTFNLRRVRGEVTGYVRDADGHGVGNAKVALRGGVVNDSALTDSRGYYEISALPERYAAIVASAPGYREGIWSPEEGFTVVGRQSTSAGQIRLEMPRFRVRILSSLPNTQVWLNNEPKGTTGEANYPFPIQDLAPGRYVLRLSRPDAEVYEQPFTITEAGVSQSEFRAELRRVVGLLSVQARMGAEPYGAPVTVDIDGLPVNIGTTPVREYLVPIGEHTVSVGGMTRRVQVRRGEVVREVFDFEVGLRAIGRFSGTRGARVAINGKDVGALPFPSQTLRVGRNTVEAQLRGFESWRKSIDVGPNETPSVEITLVRKLRWKAVLRSAAIPGWGQFYSERTGAGTVWLLAALGGTGATGYLVYGFTRKDKQFADDAAEYNRIRTTGGTLDELTAAWNRRKASQQSRDDAQVLAQYAIYGFAGLWAVNAIDALALFPRFDTWELADDTSVRLQSVAAARPNLGLQIRF